MTNAAPRVPGSSGVSFIKFDGAVITIANDGSTDMTVFVQKFPMLLIYLDSCQLYQGIFTFIVEKNGGNRS